MALKAQTQDVPAMKRLPIPPLKDTLQRFLDRVEPLQDALQNERTRSTVLSPTNLKLMETLHNKLLEYDSQIAKETPHSSYIEQFWYDSYLTYDASVVLNVNPFFKLEDDPIINNHTFHSESAPYGEHTLQIKRCAKLVTSMLKFVKSIRCRTLKPDTIHGEIPLSMDQYDKLFGSSRIPPSTGQESCHLQTDPTSHHVIIVYKSQFYWFDVLDIDNSPIFSTSVELEWNLYSIINDYEEAYKHHRRHHNHPQNDNRPFPFGLFTTESRRSWAKVRDYISKDPESTNCRNLKLIESALFVICLDDVSFEEGQEDELVKSMLCGTSNVDLSSKLLHNSSMPITLSLQHGTCLNRWYDKLQLIVTKDGKAGINFEHTGVDGHTVLRLASDIYTDSILSFARGVTPNVLDIFDDTKDSSLFKSTANLITIPRRLEWTVDNFLLSSLHFAETRISDLISQYEFVTLNFGKYGARHIKSVFKCSPDAFTQQIFQIAYYALYGKLETTYEPAMTKAFQNGRTEAIRTVTPQCKMFVKSLFDKTLTDRRRIELLHQSCKEHSRITKECSMGLGQDRHLYAMYCVWNEWFKGILPLPPLYHDNSWSILNTNILSTSNCGNPCLKSFGFGPVTANGFGIGYVIREESISIVVSSKHRQTHRFASLMEKALLVMDRIFQKESRIPSDGPISKQSPDESAHYSQHQAEALDFLLSGYGCFDVNVSG
ncbi:carnitine O-acetyltransferase YAT1 [Saccharomyces eubayanus]|uniref:carnitine O-acetyltransferase YAT1 n=1 Tax=Saccharomyces eubayanus TaxID=1080349 RepID=UPI0006C1969A|nr:YAT1-like protein [Saccharomyces eubayanus]KOH00333.1 YAT1-like protein [Saccharomyces eubayanus]